MERGFFVKYTECSRAISLREDNPWNAVCADAFSSFLYTLIPAMLSESPVGEKKNHLAKQCLDLSCLLRFIINMNTVRRKSRQRERIYEFIRASARHPTALEVYNALKKEMPALSMGNLYRNIGILVEEGRVRRSVFRDGVERFDAIVMPHYHFICERCGRVADFAMPPQESIMKKARAISRHTITDHTINFYGTCEKCGRKRGK